MSQLTEVAFLELVKRFNGKPGETGGLSSDETLEMLVYSEGVGKSKELGLDVWVDAYKDGGLWPEEEVTA